MTNDSPTEVKPSKKPPLTSYQRRLFVFLSVATFFEGYDFLAMTQLLPNLRAAFGLGMEASGYLVGFVNIGTVLAYLVVRKADHWGRRRVLTLTIAGYTSFTFLTALSPNIWLFAVCQLVARVFLIGEWAVSMVIAAEEFPANRRGMVIGVIQASSSLGSVVCAGVVPLLLETPYGWRSVYLVGVLPLIILAFARRNLRETERFQRAKPAESRSLFAIWKTPYRKRVIMMASIWFLSYIASQNTVAFWKEFALGERGMTDAEVGKAIVYAAVVAMPLVFAAGKLIDVLGRRSSAIVIFGLGAIGTVGAYTLHGFWPLTVALMFGIFSAGAQLHILNAYTAELFPTEYRGAGFAWVNNLLGRVSYIFSPVLIGIIAADLGAFGPPIAATAIFPIACIVLIHVLLPETRARELEDTSTL